MIQSSIIEKVCDNYREGQLKRITNVDQDLGCQWCLQKKVSNCTTSKAKPDPDYCPKNLPKNQRKAAHSLTTSANWKKRSLKCWQRRKNQWWKWCDWFATECLETDMASIFIWKLSITILTSWIENSSQKSHMFKLSTTVYGKVYVCFKERCFKAFNRNDKHRRQLPVGETLNEHFDFIRKMRRVNDLPPGILPKNYSPTAGPNFKPNDFGINFSKVIEKWLCEKDVDYKDWL